jgi:hypothetical protein
MNIICFLEHKLPKEMLESLYDFNLTQFSYVNDKNTIDYLNVLRTNDDVNNLINNLNIVKPEDKDLYIKLLILYLTGGLIINDKIVLNNIAELNNLYYNKDICLVKSCLFNNFFDGFMMVKPTNKIIYNILNKYLATLSSKQLLKDILYNYINSETNKKANNIAILNENILNGVSSIYFECDKYADHHFSSEFHQRLNIKKTIPNDLKKLKIGITIDLPNSLTSFYSNGIRQNSLYFYELLKNMNYDVKLIITTLENEDVIKSIDFYKYDYTPYSNILYEDFDIVFSFGFSLTANIFSTLKKYGVKIVGYFCGNSYLIDTEKILYNQHTERTVKYDNIDANKFDVMWSIPQMYKQNKHYWEVIYRTKCISVPFIWSASSINFIKQIKKLTDENELLYKKKNNNIAIFEPNISLMKWCLPCLFISELTYRKYGNINKVYMTNIDNETKPEDMKLNKFNMKEFNNICSGLDLCKNKKLSVEKRYITLDFMQNYADIAVSHQWENPLNYLYLDLAWMGWPILHNASLCKDVGYYYEEFNYEEGAEKLNEILLTHETNKTEYLNNNRKIIDRYLPSNIELQNQYRILIENLYL